MKSSVGVGICALLALLWHGWWWGLVRLEVAAPASRVREVPPLPLVLHPGDEEGVRERPAYLFALPGGPGFSRHLTRDRGPVATPDMQTPDLSLSAPRPRTVPLPGSGVLRAEDGPGDWLARLPVPPDPEPGRAAVAGGFRVQGPAGWTPDTAWMAELGGITNAGWRVIARAEVSPSGDVDHVFLESVDGLDGAVRAKVLASLRRLRFPSQPDSQVRLDLRGPAP